MSKTGRPGDAYGRGMENTLTPDRTDDHSGSADDRDILDTLTSVLARTTGLIGEVRSQDLALPTPCTDFDVRDLLEHMTTWIQVFDATVNDRPLPFDPMTHTVGGRYAEVFGIAADARCLDVAADDDYFLARLSFPYLRPEDAAEFVEAEPGGRSQGDIVVTLEDQDGAPFLVHHALTP